MTFTKQTDNEPARLSDVEEQILKIFKFSHLGIQLYRLNNNVLILAGANKAADEILEINHQKLVGKSIEEVLAIKGNNDLLSNRKKY